jgi:hypothetical protein
MMREKLPIDLTVYCSDVERKSFPAEYKIAAEWLGGGSRELKTFGFADDECLTRVFQSAAFRAAQLRLSEGEELGRVGIYRLDSTRHDYELERLVDLEARIPLEPDHQI